MDWISYGLEGLTALFTGGAMAWNFAYRSRPKWQPYVVECGYGNPPCLLVKIVNVGNGAATDVHATATHSPETPYGSRRKGFNSLVATGGCVYARIKVKESEIEENGHKYLHYTPPEGASVTITAAAAVHRPRENKDLALVQNSPRFLARGLSSICVWAERIAQRMS